MLTGGASRRQQPAEKRVIPPGIYDAEGRLLTGLKPEQITVKRAHARVVRVRPHSGPRPIILLLGMSASMAEREGYSPWKIAIRAAQEFLRAVQPNGQVALHIVQDRHQIVLPFTDDIEAIGRALDNLPHPDSRDA